MATRQTHLASWGGQLFFNDLAKQLVAELFAACRLHPNLGAKPKSSDTKTDLIYKRAFCNYL